MTEELTHYEPTTPAPVNASMILQGMQAVQQVLKEIAVEGVDYMQLPGTDREVMLQPLAEKLALGAGLVAEPKVELIPLQGDHREYRISGHLLGQGGEIRGSGAATCSTMESKYRWRYVSAPCPSCGKTGTIIKGKKQFGGGWVCWAKKDGCGSKFGDDMEFHTTKQDNPDVADVWNTVLQMALKRWLVSAVKRTLALSGMFTMDLEEMAPPAEPPKPPPKPKGRQPRKPRAPKQTKKRSGPPPEPEPPQDLYDLMAEDEAIKGRTISPEQFRKLEDLCKATGTRSQDILDAIEWNGKLVNMPEKMVGKFRETVKGMTA